MGSVLGRGEAQREGSVESRLAHVEGGRVPPPSPACWLGGCTKPRMPDQQALLPAATPSSWAVGTRPAPRGPSPLITREPSAHSQVPGSQHASAWARTVPTLRLGLPLCEGGVRHVPPAGGIQICPVRVYNAPALKPLLLPAFCLENRSKLTDKKSSGRKASPRSGCQRGGGVPGHRPSSGRPAPTGCMSTRGHFEPVASGSMASEVTRRSPPESPGEPGLRRRLAGSTTLVRVWTRVVSGLQARTPALPVERRGLCVEGSK